MLSSPLSNPGLLTICTIVRIQGATSLASSLQDAPTGAGLYCLWNSSDGPHNQQHIQKPHCEGNISLFNGHQAGTCQQPCDAPCGALVPPKQQWLPLALLHSWAPMPQCIHPICTALYQLSSACPHLGQRTGLQVSALRCPGGQEVIHQGAAPQLHNCGSNVLMAGSAVQPAAIKRGTLRACQTC